MRSVLNLAWATLERGLTRVIQALVMLVFARVTDPEAVGLYNWVALAYTLYSAIAEVAIRNEAVLCLTNTADLAYIRAAAHRSRLFGFALIGAGLTWLSFAYSDRREVVVGLLPFIIVPSLTTARIIPGATLQYHDKWPFLARAQVIAGGAAIAVSLPLAVLLRSSLAMAAHVVVTELTYLVLTRREAAKLHTSQTADSHRPPRRTLQLMAISIITWGQNQAERVFVGALVGAATLGWYSTGATIGRSGGDALGQASSSFTLARAASMKPEQRARMVGRIGLAGIGGASALVLVVTLAVDLVFTPFLGPQYAAALRSAPYFAVASIPAVVSSALQVFGVAEERSHTSIVSAVVGLSFTFPIALVAMRSLTAATFLVIGKELAVLLSYALLRRDRMSWQLLVAALVSVLAVSALLWIVQGT